MSFNQNFNNVGEVINKSSTTGPNSTSRSTHFKQIYSGVNSISGNSPDGFEQIFGNNPNGSELQNNDKEGVNVEERY